MWPKQLTSPDKSPQNLHKESIHGKLSGRHRKEKENYEMPQILLLVLEALNRNQETFVSL